MARLRIVTRRRVGVLGALVLVLALTWLVGGYFVIVRPATDLPARVDAIFVLGPPDVSDRLDLAARYAREGYASNLVVSAAVLPAQRAVCEHGVPGAPQVRVTCFQPEPATTRGEAEQLRRLVAAHHWSSVLVVTSTYHISRARMILQRCYSGRLLMVPARRGIGAADWAYQYLYQTGGYAKALLNPGC